MSLPSNHIYNQTVALRYYNFSVRIRQTDLVILTNFNFNSCTIAMFTHHLYLSIFIHMRGRLTEWITCTSGLESMNFLSVAGFIIRVVLAATTGAIRHFSSSSGKHIEGATECIYNDTVTGVPSTADPTTSRQLHKK